MIFLVSHLNLTGYASAITTEKVKMSPSAVYCKHFAFYGRLQSWCLIIFLFLRPQYWALPGLTRKIDFLANRPSSKHPWNCVWNVCVPCEVSVGLAWTFSSRWNFVENCFISNENRDFAGLISPSAFNYSINFSRDFSSLSVSVNILVLIYSVKWK